MGIWQTKQDKFKWKLYRNVFFAALTVLCGYFFLPITLIGLLFVLLTEPLAPFIRASAWLGCIWPIVIWFICCAVIMFGLPALIMPGPVLFAFFGALFIFALACSLPAVLRFGVLKKPLIGRQKQALFFLLTLLLYCGEEFFAYFVEQYFWKDQGSFLDIYEYHQTMTLWICFLFVRFYLLWDAHCAILEYDNLRASGRLIA